MSMMYISNMELFTITALSIAFQYALSSDLPKTPESTMIDVSLCLCFECSLFSKSNVLQFTNIQNYILCAYAILTVYVLEISVIFRMKDNGYGLISEYINTEIGSKYGCNLN